MLTFIARTFGHAKTYTLQEQPKVQGIFQSLIARVKSRTRLPEQTAASEGQVLRSEIKSSARFGKLRAGLARIGNPSLKRLMKRHGTSRVEIQAETSNEATAHKDALKPLREVLEKNDPATAEMHLAAWDIYVGKIDIEMGTPAENNFSLENRLKKFMEHPEAPGTKRNLTAVVAELARAARDLGQSDKMMAAARQVSFVTPQMEQIGVAAKAAHDWFRKFGNVPLTVGSVEYKQITELCMKFADALADIKSGRSIAEATSASVPQENQLPLRTMKVVREENDRLRKEFFRGMHIVPESTIAPRKTATAPAKPPRKPAAAPAGQGGVKVLIRQFSALANP